MATFVDGKYGAAFSILIGSLSVAFSDVVSIVGFFEKLLNIYFNQKGSCMFLFFKL